MAVNKNFVVKNGLEVGTDLILANTDNNRVGIATTTPDYTLHVNGGIGATDIIISGFSTFTQDVQVGSSGSVFYVSNSTNNVGVGTSVPNAAYTLDVRSSVSTGQTALYVYGDMRVTGDINLDDVTLDHINATSIVVSGFSTFQGSVDIDGRTELDTTNISETLNVVGITTLASAGGITTTGGDFYVGGDLYVLDDVVYDEVNGRNINISGIATLGTVQISSGIVTATTGIVTYYGDGSYLTGAAPGLSAAIGISSGGTIIGSGVTMVDFTATNATITATPTVSGVSTVNIQPSVSLGLVIALGG